MRLFKKKDSFLILFLLPLIFPSDARAADLTWLGVSGDWTSVSNWSTGNIPTGADTLYINTTNNDPFITTPGAVADYIKIGSDEGSTASLTVTGTNTTLTASHDITVADQGTASFVISDEARVIINGYLRSNRSEGSNSTLAVTGSGSDLSITKGLYIGQYGTSSLTIAEGATVSAGTYTILGWEEGAEGILSISGNGSNLSSTNSLYIGYYGNGQFNIYDGATVSTAAYTNIGDKATSTGTLFVTGGGSRFTSTNEIDIGRYGDGIVIVSDGGTISASNYLCLGFYENSSGSLTITGSGSNVTATSTENGIIIGLYGNGSVVVSDGGTLSTASYLNIGYYEGSNGHLTITGSGSTVTAAKDIYLAVGGDASILVSNGGSLIAEVDLEVGSGCPSAWGTCYSTGTLVVTDPGSTVNVAGDLYVGESVEGIMTISNDAAVNVTGNIYISKGNSLHSLDIGTLNIGSASGETATAAGTITAASLSFVTGTATLVFNHTDTDYDFSIGMSGSGILLAESGTTTLSGNSSGFTGTTSVYGTSTLLVTGSLAGTTTVSSGGTIGGTGTLSSLTMENEGSYTTAIAPNGSCEALTVTNAASLDGTLYLDASTSELYTVGTEYTVLTAGSPSGTFDAVASNLLFLGGNVTYGSNDTKVTVFYKDFDSAAANGAQVNTANAIQSLGLGNSFHDALWKQTTANKSIVQSAFQSSTGSLYTNLGNAMIENQVGFTNALSGRMGQASGFLTGMDKPLVAHLNEPGLKTMSALWTQIVGGWGRQEGSSGYNYSSYGVVLGSDRPFGDWRVGLAVGYQNSKYNMFHSQDAQADTNRYSVSIYGGRSWDKLALKLGATYAQHDVESERPINLVGYQETLKGSYTAHSGNLFTETAYKFEKEIKQPLFFDDEERVLSFKTTIEPYINLSYNYSYTPSFKEEGSAASLHVDAANQHLLLTTIGTRIEQDLGPWTEQIERMTLKETVGWQRAIGDKTPEGTYHFTGSNSFTTDGSRIAQDTAVFGVGINTALKNDISMDITYKGHLAPERQDHSLQGTIKYFF
ncbi:MAG: autotransporter domain-containing protein [Bdellovibrionales bacterium]